MRGDIARGANDSCGDGVADCDGYAETEAENFQEFSALFGLGERWQGLSGGVRRGGQSWLGEDGDIIRRVREIANEKAQCCRDDFVTAESAHFGSADCGFREKFEVQTLGSGGKELDRGAVVDDPVGAGGAEFFVGRGSAKGEDACACGSAGARAGGGVFDDHAFFGGDGEFGCAFEIRLGIGLAALNVAGSYEIFCELPEPGGAEADFGEFTRG